MKRKGRATKNLTDNPHFPYHPDFVARSAAARKEFLFSDPATFTERLEAHVNMTLALATDQFEASRTNTLHLGDNLKIMRRMPDRSVDLIYADPPFFTQRDFHFTGGDVAFTDKWSWDDERQREWDEIQGLGRNPVMDTDPQLARCMLGLELQVGEKTPFLAYLTFMAIRIREMRRVMK